MIKQEKELKALITGGHDAFVIHYACGDIKGQIYPKITAVVIQEYHSRKTYTFSPRNPGFLDDVFSFFREHQGAYFVHWNMDNPNFSFEHLAAGAGRSPKDCPDNDKQIFLSKVCKNTYGENYVKHNQLQQLAVLNDVYSFNRWLAGELEAKLALFDDPGIHQILVDSCEVKVSAINNICHLLIEDALKTNVKPASKRSFKKVMIKLIRKLLPPAVSAYFGVS